MNGNELKIKVSDCHQRECIFKGVPASELRLDDDFMKHQPKTEKERDFKKKVETAIKNGLKDFWRPICDPSFDDNGRICYELDKEPAVGVGYSWWVENAKAFCPERGSRLGTKSEYIAFLATLIKELIASGQSVEWAWNAVCNDSKELGHYLNSENAKYLFEPTGSRCICGFYDLGNTCKILSEDEAGRLWIAGGYFYSDGFSCPLARLYRRTSRNNDDGYRSVGWLVFDSCPDC